MEIITIEKSAIDRFKSEWPCHGISDRVDFIVAGFHNGDLIEIDVCDAADVVLEPDAYDGEAFSALLNDAQHRAEPAPFIPGTIERGRVYK